MMNLLIVNPLFSIYTPWAFSTSNLHEPWNITWQIITPSTQSVVTQISRIHPRGTWWPSLEVDMLNLLSQDPTSHTFATFDKLWAKKVLSWTGFYVCPADNSKSCGGHSDYYCAYWGCETSAEGWVPSSNYLH